VVDIGLGSPTGIAFGTKSNFPAHYRNSLFAMDWTYGRILAVQLTPKGGSYEGKFEEFLKGKAMPVTDLEFGPDGAMYFLVGGRGTQSGLYRVSYIGASDAGAAKPAEESGAQKARALRRQLEAFHGRTDAAALDVAWPQLGNEDRFIRYAARIAVESQPVAQWRPRALNEPDARAGLTALLALVRCGSNEDRDPALKALAKWPLDSLDEPLKLEKLRVAEVAFSRRGAPGADLRPMILEKLGRQFPAASFPLNRELSQLLVYLQAPDAVEKTLVLMETSTKPEEQIWYAYCLRAAEGPWSDAQRRRYFAWFGKAQDYKGGNSFGKFIERIRDLALEKAPTAEKSELLSLAKKVTLPASIKPAAPARSFVKAWTMAELTPELAQAAKGRNFARGKEIFSSALCLQCHHFGPEGGNVGPDLTAVASRFNHHDLLESIIEPSKVISEQYAAFVINRKPGDAVVGQIVEDNNDHLVVLTDLLAGTRLDISKTQFVSKAASPVSLMPPGLINNLSKEEILDLLAYIESGGNGNAPAFAK
jgi:putative heme-binding domain-containing protein